MIKLLVSALDASWAEPMLICEVATCHVIWDSFEFMEPQKAGSVFLICTQSLIDFPHVSPASSDG